MLCKRSLSRHAVSVCVCVTFVHSVKTNKHIFKMFMTRSFNVTPKTTEQHLISDKSVAYVSVRRFVLLKLTTDRHEASRGLFASAELLVLVYVDGIIIYCDGTVSRDTLLAVSLRLEVPCAQNASTTSVWRVYGRHG